MKKMNEIENNLRSLLRNNIVAFTFKKVDGTIRHALGTRNLTLASRYTQTEIPTPKGEEQPTSYFDVEKMGWRSWREGSVISIDGYKIGWQAAETPKKGELPKREIPVQKPISESKAMGGGADIGDLGGLLGGLLGGFGGGIPKDEIRKSMDKLGKDIVIGAPAHSPKIGTPTATERGIELPIGSVSVEDFAKLVAKYVVAELVEKLTR